MKPLIGIPTRTMQEETIVRYAGLATYTRAVDLAGGIPVFIPLNLSHDTLRALFDQLDGLLLQGGVDVHPREYGEPVEPFCGEMEPARDQVELQLIRWALAENKPLLGICRGIQMMNVAAGGSLYQDISVQLGSPIQHQHILGNPYTFHAHPIEIEANSQLANALGTTRLEVNSLHHQALKQIAPGFRVVARAPDGVIEGIEATQARFALGVQFHPEWMLDDDPRMSGIFEAFIQAIARG